MKTYKVYIYVAGAPWRPPYDGYVIVNTDNESEARQKAAERLLRGSFRDALREDIRVKSVEEA